MTEYTTEGPNEGDGLRWRDERLQAELNFLRPIYKAVEWLTNPDDEICGINPGHELNMLQRHFDEARIWYEQQGITP